MSALPIDNATTLEQVRADLEATLKLQRAAYFAHPVPTLAERKADLLKLKTYLRENKLGIIAAINADYGNRSTHETLLTEIVPAIGEVDHALGHLRKWMKPQRRHVDLKSYFGTCASF